MTSMREMEIGELGRIAEIDRSEEITQQYRSRDGVLLLVDVNIHAPRWGEPGGAPVERYIAAWTRLVERGGVLLGAFDGDLLLGVALYDRSLRDEPATLAVLHVTRPQRSQGIGRALTDEVVRRARADGARRLYVSATPTRATVDFYRRRGFEPLATPNETLFAREPEDIHMGLPL